MGECIYRKCTNMLGLEIEHLVPGQLLEKLLRLWVFKVRIKDMGTSIGIEQIVKLNHFELLVHIYVMF